MEPVWFCGFEWNSNLEMTFVGAGTAPTSLTYRSGSYAATFGSLATYGFYKDLPANYSELYIQFGLRAGGFGSDAYVLKWSDAGTTIGSLVVDSSGYLKLYNGDKAALLATASANLSINTWYCIELHIQVDNSGSAELRIDGTTVLTYSGDTLPGATANINRLFWYNGYSPFGHIDDIIVNPAAASWPNNGKIVLLPPTSDGTTHNFTRSTGANNYANVDEKPPSATDFNYATANDVVDEYGFGDLPAEAMNIRCARMDAWALRGSTNAPTTLKIGLKLANGDNYSDALALTTAQTLVSKQWGTNPATGSEFTVAAINDDAVRQLLKSAA